MSYPGTPQQIAFNGMPVAGTAVSAVTGTHGTFFVGNKFSDRTKPVQRQNLLLAYRDGTGSIGAPHGTFTFLFPVPLLDGQQRLHVIWAEPGADVQEFHWQTVRLTSLWTASYDPDRGWSQPERLYDGDVRWRRHSMDRPVIHPRGSLVAVPLARRGILLLRLEGTTWDVYRMPFNGPIASLSADIVGDQVVIGIVGVDVSEPDDENSVFLIQGPLSASGPWRPPRLIQRSGNAPAYGVRVRAGDREHVHLVWMQETAPRQFVLRHVLTTGDARVPSRADDMPVDAMGVTPEVARDRYGTLHVAWDGIAENAAAVQYACWRDGWGRAQLVVPAAFRSHGPDLHTIGDATVLIVGAKSRVAPADEPMHLTKVLIGR